MNCWNCGYKMADGTKVCRRCEADQTDAPQTDPATLSVAQDVIERIAPDALQSLRDLAGQCETAEDFADAILVGPCAKCGSENVGDCDDDPDYFDPFLGRCFDCGAVWCTECGHVLEENEKTCPQMAEHDEELERMMENCDLDTPPD